MDQKRSSFTGKIGFVLAAAGSAVGLGNIWRFPYLAAKYGGGIFLLVYIILAVTFGFTLMAAEIAIGRKTGLSAIGAFKQLDKRFTFVGYLAAIIPAIILPYYSVIGGWVMKYIAGFATGQAHVMAGDKYFSEYLKIIGEPIIWFLLFIGLTAVIVMLGVEKGIEKVSKVMMPVLVVLIFGVAVYTIVAMPGAWEGVVYYITPDFSKFSIMTVVAAMGQLFYSMSLAMGIMITFGSYMKKDISIEKSIHQIELFDTGVAFLAGLMIIPAVFAFSGGNEDALGTGPTLMFVTLPKVFDSMPAGNIIGAVFFVMVFFAALTSSISLMETVVSILQDKLKMKRIPACLAVLGFSLAMGLITCLGFNVFKDIKPLGLDDLLTFFDFIANNILMPVTAFFTAILVGFVLKPQYLIDELDIGGAFKAKRLFKVMIKYIAPIFIVAILVSSVLDAFDIVKM
ncbi:MAG: sodium-dependent transporter [Clostridia bacterium]|nr:sodium-dependent transporter [Clostridia bacterium]